MQATNYSRGNADFSNRAHVCARRVVYPRLFRCSAEQLTYDENTLLETGGRGKVLDGEMGIDRIVKVRVGGLKAPLRFTIQERFRRPAFREYRDVTVTEWNRTSDLPSELYKITAGLFLYGTYDPNADAIVSAVVFSVPDLLLYVTHKTIGYTQGTNPRSNQTFLAFPLDSMDRAGVIRLKYPGSG